MELSGRVVVVTGGSTGIGRAIATRFAEEGCRVAVCARSEETLRETEAAIRAAGGEALAVVADVGREEEVERLRDEVASGLGPASILVNNAGIGIFGSILDLGTDDYDRVFETNVRGVFLCTRAFAPDMVEAGDGVIVNIASLAGKNHFAGGSIYAASKHAVLGMSKSAMLDLRSKGVRVLAVCPGSVATPFFDGTGHTPDPAKVLAAEDVAETVLHAVRMSDRGTLSEIEIRPVDP
jgi:3-oxoacyl-[acyl-carrier protein] reductase